MSNKTNKNAKEGGTSKASVYNVTVHYQTKYKTQTNDAGCF